MYLSILSTRQPLFAGEITSIQLPGSLAPFQVLKGHINLISSLKKGHLSYRPKGKPPVSLAIAEGVVKVKDDRITVFIR